MVRLLFRQAQVQAQHKENKMGMKWHGEKLTRKVHNEFAKRLTLAAILFTRTAKERMSKTGARSKAFHYPFKQTGHLRRNVMYEIDRINLRARVGTNVEYGKFLQQGTRKMKRRPWLFLTRVLTFFKIRKILTKKMR